VTIALGKRDAGGFDETGHHEIVDTCLRRRVLIDVHLEDHWLRARCVIGSPICKLGY
jgi:hypothetical protein